MSDANEGIDNLLLLVTQRSGCIENLLENFFSFLARKTDFYRPPDKSNEISLDHCTNLVSYYCRNVGMRYAELISKNSKKVAGAQPSDNKNTLPSSTELLASSSPQDSGKHPELAKDTNKREDSTESGRSDRKIAEKPHETESKGSNKNMGSDKTGTVTKSEVVSGTQKVERSEDSEDDSPPPPGNGGKTQWYEWTQTLSSLEVMVTVPEGTVCKNVKVEIGTNTLNVKVNNRLLFGGELYDSVKSDESVWALVDNKMLQISLEKRNQMGWWATVVKGHPEIDVKKIVPENSKLSDLDSETRSTVEKMMFDQRQKAAGLPTSSQRSQYEALEKFKKAHPELDFSKAQINFS
ncbi:uncharacterized protein TOT_010001266 [Theileria orientalis strain Shintoku]|uniref:Nuclear migration protein nudC n=1 Tax=Theileria orientalis strain Shintoku TaxID=869250 RepID=J4C2N9_THEOR|nr:uncharacterized protein TOT_010001266 [Theileria orientalis strain Shintoku]PVC50092.1 hypothetical protein MACL_00002535 [Theileria orientalis]BAM39021.1 uncharacterized protein TOT_010001266 [Theileria orientalis strain Shintoku]|eukprot:XP_009689322.1 uncharacterized protein TOT_010001266 [Theileria orientalis strain Shintoku]